MFLQIFTFVIFISIGTTPNEDGSADIKDVVELAERVGRSINGYKTIDDKSTAPIGTGYKLINSKGLFKI